MNRRLATHAMGTRFELVLCGEDEFFLHSVGEEAIAEIQRWHRALNYFAPDSVVSAINRHAASESVPVDAETLELLLACRQLNEDTHGAFDITVGPLMKHFGFRGMQMASGDPPAFGMNGCDIDASARTLRLAERGMEIDLGGIAKGWAIDRAIDVLRSHDIRYALIHGGTSTAYGLGAPPDAAGWRIRLQNPPNVDDEPPVACLCDMALSVSAPHGRTTSTPEGTHGHVIDPRAGEPSRGAAAAAAVMPSAMNADAWSTALVILRECPAAMQRALSSVVCAQAGDHVRWTTLTDPFLAFAQRAGSR